MQTPTLTELQKKYIEKFLNDFGLQDSSPEVQEHVLATLSERFADVAVVTGITLMNPDQQQRFTVALADPDKNQDKITSLVAEIPGLQAAIEQAFLEEYEILKGSFVA